MKHMAGVILAFAFSTAFSIQARGADTISVGEAASFAWDTLPIEVGRDEGIWRKYGFEDVKPIGFAGDAKLQQALVAGDVEFGIGGGPAMAFFLKGVSAKAIAVETYAPSALSIITSNDSSIRSAADLKGKKIGISTVGSLSEWLAKQFATAQGWGSNGIDAVALGGLDSNLAALKTHEVDAVLTATAVGLNLGEKNEGRIAINCGDYVGKFISTAVMSPDSVIAQKGEMVQRFVNGFFETIVFMKAHKRETVEIGMRVFHSSRTVMDRTYDIQMPTMSSDGHFDSEGLAVLKASFVEMGMLTDKPKDETILTTRFIREAPNDLAR